MRLAAAREVREVVYNRPSLFAVTRLRHPVRPGPPCRKRERERRASISISLQGEETGSLEEGVAAGRIEIKGGRERRGRLEQKKRREEKAEN